MIQVGRWRRKGGSHFLVGTAFVFFFFFFWLMYIEAVEAIGRPWFWLTRVLWKMKACRAEGMRFSKSWEVVASVWYTWCGRRLLAACHTLGCWPVGWNEWFTLLLFLDCGKVAVQIYWRSNKSLNWSHFSVELSAGCFLWPTTERETKATKATAATPTRHSLIALCQFPRLGAGHQDGGHRQADGTSSGKHAGGNPGGDHGEALWRFF